MDGWRIQSQRSALRPHGQDFLHGVKGHGGRLMWKTMTHSLWERAELNHTDTLLIHHHHPDYHR